MGRPRTTPGEEAMLNAGWLSWTTTKEDRKFIIVAAIARVMLRKGQVSADDLHEELKPEEYPWDRRAFGAVLRGLQSSGKLAPVGYSASKRVACHGRPILTYTAAA